jgi:hypothetical protein
VPDYRPLARRSAKKYGIPQNIYLALVNQESGWNPTAGSPKGAVGLVQIHLPSHPDVSYAQATNPRFALDWGARYLAAQHKRFGNWRQALAAYNAGPGAVESGNWLSYGETTRYVKNVLAMAGNTRTGAVAPRQARVDAAAPVTATLEPETGPVPPPDLSGLALQNLGAAGTQEFDPVRQLSDLTMAVAASRTAPQPVTKPPDEPAPPPPAPPSAKPAAAPKDWQDWVVVPAARGNSSEPHKPPILQFVAGIAQTYRKPLTVWDNTTHSRYTVNGNESAHYHGYAADIPARGAKLKRLGYIALVRSGMNAKEARAASRKGGLFNVGNFQVIFATNIGGNHHDHLHVGIRS